MSAVRAVLRRIWQYLDRPRYAPLDLFAAILAAWALYHLCPGWFQ